MDTDANFTDSSMQLKEEEKMGTDANFTDSSMQLKEEIEQCLNFSIIYLPPSEEYCTYTWDGLLCWPNTPPGITAYLPCVADINGVKYDTSQYASRLCYANGTWANYTDYNLCLELQNSVERVLPTHEDILIQTTIYLTGYGLSLAALCIAVWIFLYYKDLRCLRNTIHTNLMCTYILADFMWIFNFILQIYLQTDVASCVILFILLQYLLLTNYFWMFVEGLYLYMLVVETFTRENIKLRAYLAIGWGTPLIVIIVWGLVRTFTPTEYEYGSMVDNKVCSWITFNPSEWIINASSIIVLAVNVIFLVMIMWVLITKLRSSNNVETQQYRKATKALLVLIPLLGITYILLIMGPREGTYAYIRTFLLSTQGLMVALFYCFLNSEVQNTVRHHITRWKESRNLGARRYTCSKDWSPNTRTESVRLCSKHDVMPYNKRESTASENTTMTIVGGSTNNTRLSNGSTGQCVVRAPISPYLEPNRKNAL